MSGEGKRLYRSGKNRMIAGVCAGLGEYFDIDPTLVRLAFVAMVIMGAPGVFLGYLLMMLIMPQSPVNDISIV